jgi:hypothetical protein
MADELKSGTPAEKARKVHELVQASAAAKGFTAFDIKYGEDSTDMAAVWISFYLPDDYPTDDDAITRLRDLADSVKDALFEAGIERIPYVWFRSLAEARA